MFKKTYIRVFLVLVLSLGLLGFMAFKNGKAQLSKIEADTNENISLPEPSATPKTDFVLWETLSKSLFGKVSF